MQTAPKPQKPVLLIDGKPHVFASSSGSSVAQFWSPPPSTSPLHEMTPPPIQPAQSKAQPK